MKNQPLAEPDSQLICRAAFDAPTSAPPEIMFMPAGIQKLAPMAGASDGEPVVTVLVDAAGAAAMEAQRVALAARNRKPYFDFAHENGPASFWPEQFFWKDGAAAGIYARGEWTRQGREAIEGKEYRQFSPVFHVDRKRGTTEKNPAHLVARDFASPNMGGFLNDPAFHQISPLWARNADGAHPSQHTSNAVIQTMTPEELAALQAKNKELETELTALKARAAQDNTNATLASELKAKDAEYKLSAMTLENESLKARNTDQAAAIKARNSQDADTAIKAAVARGAIPAKDEALQARWKGLIETDPSHTALLNALPGAKALEGPLTERHAHVAVTGIGAAETLKALGAIMARQKGVASLEQKSQIARDALALYARDISGNKDALDMPLMAADNTDGNLGILSGTLVAMRTIEDYEQQLIAPQFLTTDYSDVPGQYGQTTTTRIVVVPAVQTYDPTLDANGRPKGWINSTPAQTVDAPVTLNHHRGVQILLDSNTLGSTVRNLFGEQANLAGYALAKDVNDALLALITAANYPGVAAAGNTPGTLPEVVAQADFGRGAFAKASAGFNVAGVPIPGRFALLNSLYFEQLSQDPTLVSLAVFQKPEIIIGAELPAISKFQPLEAPNLPVTGNLAAFFGHKSSMVIQTRLPQDYTKILPGASFGNVSVITGKTGLSLLLVEYVNHDGGYSAWRIAIMYGCAVGNAKGGKVITSA